MSLSIGLHVGCPEEGATEVLHRWNLAVVVHLESVGLIEGLEERPSLSVVLPRKQIMCIDEDGHGSLPLRGRNA